MRVIKAVFYVCWKEKADTLPNIAGCEREEFECLLVKHNGTWQQITYAT